MSGKKGRSGRKTDKQQFELGKLQNSVVTWATTNFDNFSDGDKMRVLQMLAPKMVVQKSEVKQTIEEKKKEEAKFFSRAVREYYNNSEN